MKTTVVENRIGDKNELNGYYIYFRNKGSVCESWWGNPSDYHGDIDYLQKRGYYNVATKKDFRIFSQQLAIEMSIIKDDKKKFFFASRDKNDQNPFLSSISPKGYRNTRTDKRVRAYISASNAKEYIDTECIDINCFNILWISQEEFNKEFWDFENARKAEKHDKANEMNRIYDLGFNCKLCGLNHKHGTNMEFYMPSGEVLRDICCDCVKLISDSAQRAITAINSARILKEKQDNCKHVNISYCSDYEMRSSDMKCDDCGKYGADYELQPRDNKEV